MHNLQSSRTSSGADGTGRGVLERWEFFRGQSARAGQFESPGAGLVSALYSAECDELQPVKVTYVIA
jgi:hypothetical protein